MPTQPMTRQKVKKLIAAGALSGTVTSDAFSMVGQNQLAILADLDWTAATAVYITVQVSHDNTIWFPLQSASIVAGVATMTDLTYKKAVAADDEWAINLSCDYPFARLVCTADGATADTLDVYIIQGVV